MVELSLLLSLFFLLGSVLDLPSLFNGSLVLCQIFILVLLCRHQLLHGCNKFDGHFDILFVFGLVSVSFNFLEQFSVKLGTFRFGPFKCRHKLLHLFLELLIIAHHFLVFMSLMQFTSETECLKHRVKISCRVFTEILLVLLKCLNSFVDGTHCCTY